MNIERPEDAILLSDINYEPNAFATLKTLVFSLLHQGKTILLSTPQRLMAKDFIHLLLPVCKQQEERTVYAEETQTAITILVLGNH